MSTRFNLSEWAVKHRALVLFLLLGTLLCGAFAASRLGRLEDPVFNVPTMTVVAAWPGATAQEVQDQLLNRIERALQDIEGIDHVRSFARQGYGGINFWMEGGTPGPELERAWYLARKKIGDVRHEFPPGVLGPFFNDEFSDVISVMYALRAPGLDWPAMHVLAEDLKRGSQTVAGVTKVSVIGRQGERIWVEFSTRKLAAMRLHPQQLIEVLNRQNVVAPAGAVEGEGDRVFARVDAPRTTPQDIEALTIAVDGRTLRLGDVARVHAGVEDPPAYTVRHQGEPALVLAYTFARSGNILDIGRALDQRMEGLQAALPAGVSLTKVADQPQVVRASVREFERAFLEALAIVLAVCFLSLGWRTGVVVAASVPLVLAMVAIVMWAAGWSLDRISLGALIIALGLLVDDAIIAAEMMVVKIEQGWSRIAAATFAWTSTAFPMLTGTLVTVAGFMPVGFARSISGEYAGGIFWVVGLALIASWFVAVVFTPYLGTVLLPERATPLDDPHARPLQRRLRTVLRACVAHPFRVLAGTATLFVLAVAGMGLVQQQFFPTASRTELIVDLRLREGASFQATEAQVRRLEERLARDPQISQYTAYTGAGAPRFFLSISADLPNPGFAQFVIQTASIPDREAVRARLLALFADEGSFPVLRGRVTRFEFGPPVGFPVQFRVLGPDASELRKIAGTVRDIVRQSPLVRDTQMDWNEQVRSMKVVVDHERARQLGLHGTDVASQLQIVLDGATVARLHRGEELVDLVLRGDPAERQVLERLQDTMIFGPAGVAVPLSQIARLEAVFEEPVLWRRNRDLAITVRSDVVDGVQGPHATQRIQPSLQPVIDALPAGYRIEAGGAIEESDKSNRALFAVFPLMFLVMLLILMVQLQNFPRMFMVFMTAPLGLIGVVPALLAFDAPFGFVALLGVIALGGMIMRNSVILVDQIDRDIAAGQSLADAVVEATVRRARPVVLTAAAAVLAMVPLTGSVFWGPMAIAIMGGLIGATGLTLAFVPALYVAWLGRPTGRLSSASTGQPQVDA